MFLRCLLKLERLSGTFSQEKHLKSKICSPFNRIVTCKNKLIFTIRIGVFSSPRIDKPKALSLLLHTADISHPAKNWDLHHRWTTSLLEEFFRQVWLMFLLKMRLMVVCSYTYMWEEQTTARKISSCTMYFNPLSVCFLFSSDCPFIQSHISLREDYHRLQKREHLEKCVIWDCLHLNINLWK